MARLEYKLWARIEVYNSEEDEHTDLEPELCEYKLFESSNIGEVADFIMRHQHTIGKTGVLLELEDALTRQGFIEGE